MVKRKELQQSLTVKKPNQTVTITHGNITLSQRKAYNTMLRNAQHGLRADGTKTKFTMPVDLIKKQAGLENKNNLYLKGEFEALMRIIVSCVDDTSEAWLSFVLVSHAGVEGDIFHYGLPDPVRQALIQNDFYTTLDLVTIRTFKSKYAVILYEIAMRYYKVQIPEYDIDTFKAIMGAKNYKSYGLLRKYVIEPAVTEITEKSDFKLTYETTTAGRGGKIVAIKFTIEPKSESEPTDTETTTEPTPEISALLALKISKRQTEKILKSYPADQITRNVELAKSRHDAGAVDNLTAYTIEAIREDYAATAAANTTDPKIAALRAEARKCHAKNPGCSTAWKTYRDQPDHICHHCVRFAEKRI